MTDTPERALERRIDNLEHSLVSGRELQAMRDRSVAAALQNIEGEMTQLWQRQERQSEKWEASLKERADALKADVEKVRDAHWKLIGWAAALLATQILGLILRKAGLT